MQTTIDREAVEAPIADRWVLVDAIDTSDTMPNSILVLLRRGMDRDTRGWAFPGLELDKFQACLLGLQAHAGEEIISLIIEEAMLRFDFASGGYWMVFRS